MRLGPDLIYRSNPVTVRSLPKNKKRDNSTFSRAFQDFLRIAPDIFEETFETIWYQVRLSKTKERVYLEGKIPLE